jgi:hypothetical protein
MKKAKFVKQITVIDPDTRGTVLLEVYKHENGGMFAIDSSYLEEEFDDDEPVIADPFQELITGELVTNHKLILEN